MERTRFYRFTEMIPGGLVWATLIPAVVLSFFHPIGVITFIILFDLYWLFRVLYFVIILVASWSRYRRDTRIDWLQRAEKVPRYDDIYHLIMLPTAGEDLDVLQATFRGLLACAYPRRERFIVVLAGEERKKDHFLPIAAAIEKEFGKEFFRFLVTVHPMNLPDEIVGKGSNNNWAGHRAQELIDGLGIPYENVIVSAFDCDTIAHPQYFAHLAYKYLTHPDPTRTSYQPVALYNNNIWDASAPVRIASFGTTYWLLSELARPERLSTFASHSMPFKALVDVGFWQKDIVTEDSRIFLQCLNHYDGDYTVTPMYIPVSMDSVVGETYHKSLVNLYKQQRRWAWGVEHFPYLVDAFRKNPRLPLGKKVHFLWTLTEGMYTWATAPVLIFLLGRLPLWLAPEASRSSAFYQNAPHTLQLLMMLSMVGVLITSLLSFTLLPPRPSTQRHHVWLIMILQWLLVPVTFVVFGAFPAIDAQTRLMLGKYLGFNVTQKKRTA